LEIGIAQGTERRHRKEKETQFISLKHHHTSCLHLEFELGAAQVTNTKAERKRKEKKAHLISYPS
jgi:hypothetical protein